MVLLIGLFINYLYLYWRYSEFQVHASTLINLLQSDIKMALKSAFSNLEGPLSVTDWCQGRNQSVDIGSIADCISAESSISECRDSSDPMSPSQSSSGIKGRVLLLHK